MKVAVTGATGRMGGEVLAAAGDRGHERMAVSRNAGDVDTDANAGAEAVYSADAVATALADEDPDALVDFTVPEASVDYVAACAEAGVPAVVGTTGFDEDGWDALETASESVAVLYAPNFARGIATLLSLVREAAGALEGYDVELTETHHNGKRDAPSGTAESLLEAVEGERETTGRTYGREGIQPRETGEVGVHVRRAGDVRGEHELLFAGNDEVVTLTHRAESRRVFAAGALDAAEWLAGREPGRYDFEEVLAGSEDR